MRNDDRSVVLTLDREPDDVDSKLNIDALLDSRRLRPVLRVPQRPSVNVDEFIPAPAGSLSVIGSGRTTLAIRGGFAAVDMNSGEF